MNSIGSAILKFPYLKYEVATIVKNLEDYPELDCFMFLQNLVVNAQGDAVIQLLSYPHGNTIGSTPGYHEHYYNPNFPDKLAHCSAYKEFEAPIIFTPNIFSKAKILQLIGATPDLTSALIFVPFLSAENRIYYKVKVSELVNGEHDCNLMEGDDPMNTNPSPPATIDSTDSVS